MSQTTSDPLLQKETGWIAAILRFIFFVAVFFSVIFTVMANMGGNSDTLKESIEGFVSKSFGGNPAKVQRLNRMSFFPSIGIDIEGLQVTNKDDKGEILFSAGKIRIFMSFWDVMNRTPQMSAFAIEDLRAKRGILGDRRISVGKAYIDHNRENNTAVLRADGMWGTDPWTASIGLQVTGKPAAYSYLAGPEKPVTLNIGGMNVSGTITDKVKDYLRLEDFTVSLEEQKEPAITGLLSFSMLDLNMMKLRGDLVAGAHKTHTEPEIVIDYDKNPTAISGTLKSENLNAEDIQGPNSLYAVYDKVDRIFGRYSDRKSSLDLDITLQKIQGPGKPSNDNSLHMKLQNKGDIWSMSDIKGSLNGAAIEVPTVTITTEDALITAHVPDGKVDAAAADFLGATLLPGFVADAQNGDIAFHCGIVELTKQPEEEQSKVTRLSPETQDCPKPTDAKPAEAPEPTSAQAQEPAPESAEEQ
ncbi:MAG: hypothetical protein KDI13_09700 [Alphaproteobacteria bacterium]|nr:hypothetical protein [Alphaproteobacteria bacterium]